MTTEQKRYSVEVILLWLVLAVLVFIAAKILCIAWFIESLDKKVSKIEQRQEVITNNIESISTQLDIDIIEFEYID